MTYIVEVNDNLLSIADKFGVSVYDLIKENNLDYIYSLVPGLELIIPTNNKNNNYSDNNNTSDNSTFDNQIEKEELEQNPENNNINTNGLFSYYIVEKGDNLYQIGKRYNVSPQVIADLNGININDIIYPNQQIMVPRDGIGLYITKDGDTMQSISKDLNILPEDILIENQVVYLLPDQLLAYKNINNID